jgi:peptidoglycan/xylan/chitin deacetylase (PgdA/CDA1 family)
LGTYFVSFGLLGSDSPSGLIASEDDLRHALLDGHELGCHTYGHQDSLKASTGQFEQSIFKNQQALAVLLPDATFSSFAYPISSPRPAIKRLTGKHFHCCRGGGQTINVDTADLNLLKAYFLDIRNRNNIDAVKMVIDHNVGCRGWLIFATHDVADAPSRYGCATEYFKAVVEYAARSGASLLTVAKAFEKIQSSNTLDIDAH